MPNPDELAPLGRSGLSVARLAFGGAPIGREQTAEGVAASQHALAFALNGHGRLIDTAPFYGAGHSERMIAEAVRAHRRDGYVLSTKVGRLIEPNATGSEPGFIFDFSYDGVMRSLESSLSRLGLPSVDIVHIHDPDSHFDEAVGGAVKALSELRQSGAIRAMSAGMNQWQMLMRFMDVADFDCFLLAGRYTLLDRSAADEFLPACADRNIGVILGGVFNSGLLADPRPGARYDYRPASEEMVARAQRLQQVCARHDVPLKAAALQFPLRHPAVTTILSGVRNAAEWQENAELLQRPIANEVWEDLEKAAD